MTNKKSFDVTEVTAATSYQQLEAPALDSRPAKPIEKKLNSVAQKGFVEGEEDQKSVSERKRQIRQGRAEAMLEKYKATKLSLKDEMFLLIQLQTLISGENKRILSPHLMDMAERSKLKSDELAEEQKSKTASALTALGGMATVFGALLQAAKLTSTALPFGLGAIIPAMLQVTEQGANPLIAAGQFATAGGQIATNLSQSEQQKLRHMYQWIEERLKDIERLKNQASQEEKQALDKLSQQLSEMHRAISDLLTRQN